MKRLAAESGKSFDPKVVEVLQRRYQHSGEDGDRAIGADGNLDSLPSTQD